MRIRTTSRRAQAFAALFLSLLSCAATCNGKGKPAITECPAPPPDDDNFCGCAQAPCQTGTVCFQGHCCQPDLDGEGKNDEKRCGCKTACDAGEVCVNSQCCDPTTASTQTSCGCKEDCTVLGTAYVCTQDDATHVYACKWTPGHDDTNNCGSEGHVCPLHEHCIMGQCECDPQDTFNVYNDENCGCTGIKCPADAHCNTNAGNTCVCFDADKVFCGGACAKQHDCLCDPAHHQFDSSDCVCQGACAAGTKCEMGACVCDNALHEGDSEACGCPPVSCTGGRVCTGGLCTCPPQFDSDNVNCGCTGAGCDVAHGWYCSGGACACSPEANANNNVNCGCSGTMCQTQDGFTCAGGICVCSPGRLSDPTSCGCPGIACASGEVCQGGVCTCPPAQQGDNDACGCPAVKCDTDYGEACMGGVCVCAKDKGCGKCIDVDDILVQPLALVGGDAEFNGHGPFVTVTVHISNPGPGSMTITACVDMLETTSDWTHGQACTSQQVSYNGGLVLSPSDFMVKYTDSNHDPDDALHAATSVVQNPVVLGVTCIGDTYGDDVWGCTCSAANSSCLAPNCSGCMVQLGCVMVAPP